MTDAPEQDPPEGLDLLERHLAWREISTGDGPSHAILPNSAADPLHPVTPIGGRTD